MLGVISGEFPDPGIAISVDSPLAELATKAGNEDSVVSFHQQINAKMGGGHGVNWAHGGSNHRPN